MFGGLTPRGLGLLAAVAVLWAVGRLVGVDPLFAVAIACGVLVVSAATVVRLSARSLSVRRYLTPARLPFGAPAECRIQITNTSRLPSGTLYLADNVHWSLAEPPQMIVASLRPGRSATVSYPLRGTLRGRHPVGPLSVQVTDPFGLCRIRQSFTTRDHAIVYPRIEELVTPARGGNQRGSGTSSQRRLFNTGDEFHTLREYVQGDDLRLVNWGATAKWQKLMVRQHEQPWDAEATVFIDTRSIAHHGSQAASTLEKTLSAAASTIIQLTNNGYRVRLCTADDQQPTDFEPSLSHLDRLAQLQPSGHARLTPALHTLMKSGNEGILIAVLPAPLSRDAGNDATVALRAAGRRHSTRQAVLVHRTDTQAENARSFAAKLAAVDWSTVTLGTDEPFAAAWQQLHVARRAHIPQATMVNPGTAR